MLLFQFRKGAEGQTSTQAVDNDKGFHVLCVTKPKRIIRAEGIEFRLEPRYGQPAKLLTICMTVSAYLVRLKLQKIFQHVSLSKHSHLGPGALDKIACSEARSVEKFFLHPLWISTRRQT